MSDSVPRELRRVSIRELCRRHETDAFTFLRRLARPGGFFTDNPLAWERPRPGGRNKPQRPERELE